jgi:hypothetical protein
MFDYSQYSDCPICGDPMISDYITDFLLTKTCDKRLNHSLILKVYNERVSLIKLVIDRRIAEEIIWVESKKDLLVIKRDLITNKSININLPWIDPDFSDYKKLCNKIRTLIVFS